MGRLSILALVLKLAGCHSSGPPSKCAREYDDIRVCFSECDTATCLHIGWYEKQLPITDPDCIPPAGQDWFFCVPPTCPSEDGGMDAPCQVGHQCDYADGNHCMCVDRVGNGYPLDGVCHDGQDFCIGGGGWACGNTTRCFESGADCMAGDSCNAGGWQMTCDPQGHWLECGGGCPPGTDCMSVPYCVYRVSSDCAVPGATCATNCTLPPNCWCDGAIIAVTTGVVACGDLGATD